MYLGDGHIAHLQRAYALRIYLHRDQVDIIENVRRAITTLLPANSVSVAPRRGSAGIVVICSSQSWPALFPQHGPGRKHLRPIVLASWQEAIVCEHPVDFIRGCIDSDGCRHRRVVNGKNYPAYSFSNRSEDILKLFARSCDLLGLRWRRASRIHIDVTRRADVARLDRLLDCTSESDEASS